MAFEENLRSMSFDSDASIALYTGISGQPGSAVPNGGKQYCALKLTGKRQVGLAGPTDKVWGILQNKPQKPGQAATVAYSGASPCIAGAAITVGAEVIPDAAGRLVPGSTVAGSRRLVAITPAAGLGEMFTAMFT